MKTGKYALSESAYAILKDLVQIWLPALATLYFTLGGIWNWAYVEQVIGTIAAVGVFLGALLKISTSSYNNSEKQIDGVLTVEHQVTPDGQPTMELTNLNITKDAKELSRKKNMVIQVQKTSSE